MLQNSSPVVLTSLPASIWKEEAESFIFDPCMAKPHPARRKKKMNFLLDENVQKEIGTFIMCEELLENSTNYGIIHVCRLSRTRLLSVHKIL